MTDEPLCPECGRPATVVDRFVLFSSTGPVLHIRTACEEPEHFEQLSLEKLE